MAAVGCFTVLKEKVYGGIKVLLNKLCGRKLVGADRWLAAGWSTQQSGSVCHSHSQEHLGVEKWSQTEKRRLVWDRVRVSVPRGSGDSWKRLHCGDLTVKGFSLRLQKHLPFLSAGTSAGKPPKRGGPSGIFCPAAGGSELPPHQGCVTGWREMGGKGKRRQQPLLG